MIKQRIETILRPRLMVLNILKDFTPEQLNAIPNGFNNNIIWNLGHMVAAQQGICYKRAALPTFITEEFFNAYKSESKPEGFSSEEQIDKIKTLLLSSLDQFEKDYEANIFTNYPTWATRYGVEIRNIDDAIAFLPFHEGLHIGYIMAMRKLV